MQTLLLILILQAKWFQGLEPYEKTKTYPFRDAIELFVVENEQNAKAFDAIIQKLTNTSGIAAVSEKVDGASFRVKSNEYYIPIAMGNINVAEEQEKLHKELKRAEGFLFGIQKKLSNERFVNNAPEAVLASRTQKRSRYLGENCNPSEEFTFIKMINN